MWVNGSPRHQLSSNHHITSPLPCHYLKKHNKVHSRTKGMTIFNYTCNKLSLTTQVINQHWHSYVLGRLCDAVYCKIKKGKSVPLQAWCGPEDSRKLRFPDFMTTAQGGDKVFSLMHWPHLPLRNSPGTHFC